LYYQSQFRGTVCVSIAGAGSLETALSLLADSDTGHGRMQDSAVLHAVSSQTAGGLSTLAFYPLDVVKVRFMSQDGTAARQHNSVARYTSVPAALRVIVEQEGAAALFRGAPLAVGASAASWGLFMLLYRWLDPSGGTDFGQSCAASACGNVAVAVATNPLWLIKARMQLEEADTRRAGGAARQYGTLLGGLRHVVATTGGASLWRGTSAQLLVAVPNALNFPVYEAAKRWRLRASGRAQLSTPEVCACSVVAKVTIAVASHPLVLVKVRLQDTRSRTGDVQYASLGRTVLTVLRREGARGMFRGLVPALAQTVPRGLMQFVIYEGCVDYFRTRRPSAN
jgi:hypothetical protein